MIRKPGHIPYHTNPIYDTEHLPVGTWTETTDNTFSNGRRFIFLFSRETNRKGKQKKKKREI